VTLRLKPADLALQLGLCAAEVALWSGRLGGMATLTLHVGLVALTWVLGAGTGRPLLQLAAVLTLGTGPFGAAVAVVTAFGLRLANPDPGRQADWYRLLSGATHEQTRRGLAQDLVAGRAQPQLRPRHGLAATFSGGTRTEKQAALRWLVQQDLDAFRSVLRRAMDDSDPAIRIEAAALFARLPEN
jgi:hypothetical protein